MNPSDLLPAALHTQEHRLFTLEGPVPGAGLLLDQFTGTEAVSAPFQFTLHLLSERADLPLKAFLGKAMQVSLRTSTGAARLFHGHVTAFRHTGTDGGFARFEATLGPWTEFLTHRTNCRLFQGKNLPTILRLVFAHYKTLPRFEFAFKEADYPPITFCAQYRESDWHFLSRLLEAHGIHYTFRFEAGAHVLVLANDSTTAPPLPQSPRLAYNALPGAATADTIDHWALAHRLVPTAFATKTFDFKNPKDPLNAVDQSTAAPPGLPPLEHFEHGGAYGFPDFKAGEQLARLRLEELATPAEIYTGASNCRVLTCGHSFELLGHYHKAATPFDRQYFLTAITHTGHNNHTNRTTAAAYRNTFTCVPKLIPFRPARRTPRPLIHGPQTAIVVGPPKEEIYCDAHGRVLIQFHWDREGEFNDASSCWVRVSSPWSGSRFGFVAIPRVGQEVVVEFLDGDPDRPLITGAVYNELKQPPWELPGNRTQSGLLTRSTPEGTAATANALRFEDKKGAEEVWLHAERNQRLEVEKDESHDVGVDRRKTIGHDETTEVKHDRTETVGNDETITIGHDRTEQVGHDEHLTVQGNRTRHVGADEDVTITGHQDLTVDGAQNLTVGATRNESVFLASTEQVGGAKTLSVGAAYAVTVGAAKNEAVGAASFEEVGEAKTTRVGSTYKIEVTDQLEITVGKSRLVLAKDGTITLAGEKISVEAAESIKLNGKIIDLN
jgi:type VI secretion system secreted protein VgrG